ncbi:MAG: hypothetical protein LBH43_15425 [Treponema sp.]|jgi:hypothetical protein|nr:hypothetical protein [Treponema sp.]
MTITVVSLKTKGVITIKGDSTYRLERKGANEENWLVWTANGFTVPDNSNPAIAVSAGDFLDNHEILDGIFSYKCVEFDDPNPKPTDYEFSNWVRYGATGPMGWSFGNYQPPPGQWGEICTPDDLRESWIWGTEFRATNGKTFSDAQIRYFVDLAVAEMERVLNITIKKVRVRGEPESRGMVKGQDYDVDESLYEFKYMKIQKYGTIVTRKHPIIKLHGLNLLNWFVPNQDLLSTTIVDRTKGVLKMLKRPIKPNETSFGIQTALNPYGREQLNPFMFYRVDYDAGFETAADVPLDLRSAISKSAAIALLNSIGDGLMAGFSSSSLSMDGMSESFSSTQSATSAYFGARIQQYHKELESFIEEVKRKYGHIAIGSI